METPVSEFLKEWPSAIGISPLVGIGVAAVTSLLLSLYIYRITMSGIFTAISAVVPFVICASIGLIPVWMVPVIVSVAIGYFVWNSGNAEEADVQVDADESESYWMAYGRRLKAAYSSKFGGENPEFNKSVDHRVAIMENNGRGFTRGMAKDWLKRMRKFTEAK